MKRAAVVILIFVGLIYVAVRDTRRGLREKLDDKFSLTLRAKSALFCLKRNPCTFRLEQFLPGDWDHIYVFNPGATQEDVLLATGKSLPLPEGTRLAVFMHDKAIVRTVTEHPEGDDKEDPDYHLVDFAGVPTQEHHLMLARGQLYLRTKGDPCDNCVTLKLIPPGTTPE